MNYNQFWQNLGTINQKDINNYEENLLADCRSSTIFPVYKDDQTTTSIEFLTYWIQKHGNVVIVKLTARDLIGNIVRHHYMPILKYCAVSINISDYFAEENLGFCGSVEVEVFSEKPPRYTFPAITLSIISKNSASVVHSCIRTYNKFEKVNDYALNYPQAGFDVEVGLGKRNYICFFGGYQKEYYLKIKLNENSIEKEHSLRLKNIHYGQSHFIFVEDLFPSNEMKLYVRPKCTIEHDFIDIFPRFYVGIIEDKYCPTLTHSFFDTYQPSANNGNTGDPIKGQVLTSTDTSQRATNESPERHYDSAFMIPIHKIDDFSTSLMTYGQNLVFNGRADLKIIAAMGDVVYSHELTDSEISLLSNFSEFNLTDIIEANSLQKHEGLSLHIGFVNKDIPFPVRFKIGLNVRRKIAARGANICFAPVVMRNTTLLKPFTRKWFPLGGMQKFIASIHTTSLSIGKTSQCVNIKFEFTNSQGHVLTRLCTMGVNSSIYFDPATDGELESFLNHEAGWCMVTADTYMLDAYYFTTIGEQIGGDHAY